MSRLTKVVAVAVLALWGLATIHCDLEQLPGFTFLACCHPQGGSSQQDNGCSGDACSIVESGLYKTEEQAPVVAAPLWVLAFVLELSEAAPEPAACDSVPLNDSPPELPRGWQFFYRTALPPRAPSLMA